MPLPGDDIKIKYQLPDYRTDRFVRATVRDHDDVALAGSPLGVAHVDKGLHTNNDLTYPDTDSVTIQIEVFKDALFTKRARTYAATAISIERSITATTEIKSASVDRIFAVVRDDLAVTRMTDPIAKIAIDDPQATSKMNDDKKEIKQSDDQAIIRSY